MQGEGVGARALCRLRGDAVALKLMRLRFRTLPVALFVWIAWSCAPAFAQTAPPASPASKPPGTAAPDASPQLPDAPSSASQVRPPAVPTGPTVVFDTSMGRMTCKLFSKEAPVTTANFVGLAEGTKDWTDPVLGKMHGKRYYDGVTFHRVIPNFMVQAGDRTGGGNGDAGYFFDNENLPSLLFDVPGRLAMANAGPNTNSSQFFITETAYPDLDGGYTIFGQCDAHSVLVAATIARVPRNAANKPDAPVTINKVSIVRDGEPMPPDPAAAPAAPAVTPAASPAAPKR